MEKLDDLITAVGHYQQDLAARKLAPRTRVEYETDVDDLLNFLNQHCGVHTTAALSRQHLNSFLAQLDRRGLTSNTRRRKISAIRSFLVYLEREQFLYPPLANRLVLPERESALPRVLSSHEYQRLLEAVQREPRERAIVELILQTGLGLSEAARLRLADVELPTEITRAARAVGRATTRG